jgi:hypothetical protein
MNLPVFNLRNQHVKTKPRKYEGNEDEENQESKL